MVSSWADYYQREPGHRRTFPNRHEISGHYGSSRERSLGLMVAWSSAGRIREQRSLGRPRSGVAHLTGLGISISRTIILSSGQRRKRDEEFIDGSSGKGSRLIESPSDVANVGVTVGR